jgi:hypothetical protein
LRELQRAILYVRKLIKQATKRHVGATIYSVLSELRHWADIVLVSEGELSISRGAVQLEALEPTGAGKRKLENHTQASVTRKPSLRNIILHK